MEEITPKHPILQAAIVYMRDAFKENPHYSFNDWTIMADHSENVMKYALLLSETEDIDALVVGLAGLLHDIGKTVKTDEETLLQKHEELGIVVSNDFVDALALSAEQKKQVKNLFMIDFPSLEKQVVKDADYMDFFTNERLHDAFKKWADDEKLEGQVERKLQRFEKMMPRAKELTRPYYDRLKLKWDA